MKKFIGAFTLTLVLATSTLAQSASHLQPVWDGVDYFVVQPAEGLPVFMRRSVDDTLELAVKVVTLYSMHQLLAFYMPSLRYRLGLLPVTYIVANEVGDAVGDLVETYQDSRIRRTGIGQPKGIGTIINDFTEDVFSVGCYASKFARGFAPSKAFAQLMRSYGAPVWVAAVVEAYAYFAAATRVLVDVNQCTTSGDYYGDWAEEQWNALRNKVSG